MQLAAETEELSLPERIAPALIKLRPISELRSREVASAEQKLIEAAQQGHRPAFDALVRRHMKDLRKFVSKKVAREQVDDLLQEILVATWSSLADFDSRSQFKTWVYGICINKCKTHYRTMQRRLSQVPLEVAHEKPQNEVRTSELEDHLPPLLDRLSPTHRELLDLYYYGELTLPEIARALDRNLNTVKYQFYRAHAEMAAMLREVAKR